MKQRTKKTLSGVTAVVCALAVLLTGTFAWQAMTSAVNPFSGVKEVKAASANLHDNFDAKTGDKDVFVENTGIAPVYVRIKLQEVLDKTQATAPAVPQWVTHIPGNTVANCGHANGYHSAFRNSFVWQMGGASKTYNSITGTTAWASNVSREERDKLVADSLGDTQAANKANTNGSGTGKTLPATTVIKMADYLAKTAADKVAFVGWVYDTDGYAYWSQQLAPGEATGLLLDGVLLPADETYYYGINVIMEYVDETDLPAWLDSTGVTTIKEGSNARQTTTPATANANNLLSRISPIKDRVGSIFTASGWEWIVIGLDGQGNALVVTKDVIGMSIFNPMSTPWQTRGLYKGSVLEGVMEGFYNALEVYDAASVTTEMKITSKAQPSDFESKLVPYADRADAAYSSSGRSQVDASGKKVAFPLSYQEMMRLTSKPELFLAQRAEPGKAISSIGLNENYWEGGYNGVQRYWLRSEGNDTQGASYQEALANVWMLVSPVDNASIAVRPALWISID